MVILVSGLSILSKKISNFIEKIWFNLALVLSKIIPNILLCLVYFFLLTPLALLSKIFKAKTDFKLSDNSVTNYEESDKSFTKDSFEKSW